MIQYSLRKVYSSSCTEGKNLVYDPAWIDYLSRKRIGNAFIFSVFLCMPVYVLDL